MHKSVHRHANKYQRKLLALLHGMRASDACALLLVLTRSAMPAPSERTIRRGPKTATRGWRLGGRRRGRATSLSLASGTLLEREEKECRKHFCSRKVVYRYTLVYL